MILICTIKCAFRSFAGYHRIKELPKLGPFRSPLKTDTSDRGDRIKDIVFSIEDSGLNTGQLWTLKFKSTNSSRNGSFPFFSSTFTEFLLGTRHCTAH